MLTFQVRRRAFALLFLRVPPRVRLPCHSTGANIEFATVKLSRLPSPCPRIYFPQKLFELVQNPLPPDVTNRFTKDIFPLQFATINLCRVHLKSKKRMRKSPPPNRSLSLSLSTSSVYFPPLFLAIPRKNFSPFFFFFFFFTSGVLVRLSPVKFRFSLLSFARKENLKGKRISW